MSVAKIPLNRILYHRPYGCLAAVPLPLALPDLAVDLVSEVSADGTWKRSNASESDSPGSPNSDKILKTLHKSNAVV